MRGPSFLVAGLPGSLGQASYDARKSRNQQVAVRNVGYRLGPGQKEAPAPLAPRALRTGTAGHVPGPGAPNARSRTGARDGPRSVSSLTRPPLAHLKATRDRACSRQTSIAAGPAA